MPLERGPSGLFLPPGAWASQSDDVVRCAANDCNSTGPSVGRFDWDTGQWVPRPPDGWGEIEADYNGSILVLFVCSPACERQLARGLAAPRRGEL